MEIEFEKQINDNYPKIWLGRDSIGRKVIVKFFEESEDDFLIQSAKALVRVNHENVVKVHSVTDLEHPKTKKFIPCMVMNFIEGETLMYTLTEKSIEKQQAISIGDQLINAIEATHNEGILHGDLHDENIMISTNGQLKLIDMSPRSSFSKVNEINKQTRIQSDLVALLRVLTEIIKKSELSDQTTKFSQQLPYHKNLSIKEIRSVFQELDVDEKKLNVISTAPTVFFYDRLSEAFPGVRGLEWFSGENAIKGLTRLLKKPIYFSQAKGHGTYTDPIWWFRGKSASSIKNFELMEDGKVLLNYKELLINKIAIFNPTSYYQCFVYIETSPDNSCGVYSYTKNYIKDLESSKGYYDELYGIDKNKNIVTLAQLEDGAATINGDYIKLKEPKLRARFLTKYNLIIVPKSSPYNSNKGNLLGHSYMNSILKGDKTLEDFASEYEKLEKSHMDY